MCATLTVIDNPQGTALCGIPNLQELSSESNDFDAKGVDYGVNLNLYFMGFRC